MNKFLISLLLSLSFPQLVGAQDLPTDSICQNWTSAEVIGTLPNSNFPEVSGMIASPNIPGRLYLINDSGDGPYFYSYDLPSGDFEKVEISGFKGWDIEAISFGPCGSNRSCVFIGDIGDNQGQRKIIRIAAVVEKERYGSKVRPLFHKVLSYPDGGKDSEAFVISQAGDLYLFSKEAGWVGSNPTKVYNLSSTELRQKSKSTLKKLGEFDLYNSIKTPFLKVTDAALSSDQTRLFLLGYFGSYELDFQELVEKLQGSKVAQIENYVSVGTGFVQQNEAATYTPDGESIIWTYESKSSPAPLLQKTCLK